MESNISVQTAKDSGISGKQLTELIEIAKKAALIGGDVLMKYYQKIVSIHSKGRQGDLVTNADIEAEKLIITYLNSKTKDYGIYAEEGGISGPKGDFVWCIDPLDGTTNYAHGYPFFATSIGLTWRDRPLLGAICVPYFNELYWASPTKGSFCNDNLITVSTSQSLAESLLVTGFAYDRHSRLDNNYAEFCWLTHRTRGVRRGGAASVDLAYVASGKIDGYWERGLSPWDIAAGVPIVELAGGSISDYKNHEFELKEGRILATNKIIKKELLSELKKVRPLEAKSFGG